MHKIFILLISLISSKNIIILFEAISLKQIVYILNYLLDLIHFKYYHLTDDYYLSLS